MTLANLGKYVLVPVLLEWVKDIKSLVLLDTALNHEERVIVKRFMCEYAGKFESTLQYKTLTFNWNAFQWLSSRGIGGWRVKISSEGELQELVQYQALVDTLILSKLMFNADSVQRMRHFRRLHWIDLESEYFGEAQTVSALANTIIVHNPTIVLREKFHCSKRSMLMAILHRKSKVYSDYDNKSELVARTAAWYINPPRFLRSNQPFFEETLIIRAQQPDPLQSLAVWKPTDDLILQDLIEKHPELTSLHISGEPMSSALIQSVVTYSFNLTFLTLTCDSSTDYSPLGKGPFRLKTLSLAGGNADTLLSTKIEPALLSMQHLHVFDNALSPVKMSLLLANLIDLTTLNISKCDYGVSVFSSMASRKLRLLDYTNATMDSFIVVITQARKTLTQLSCNYDILVEARSVILSLPELQYLDCFTADMKDSDFPEEWVNETIELFRPRLCYLNLCGVNRAKAIIQYDKTVQF